MGAPIKGYEVSGNTWKPVRIDASTNSLQTIEYEYHEVHAGDSFHAHYSVADLGAMTSPDDMIQLHFTTPDSTKWIHMVIHARISGSGSALYTLTEAPTGGLASATGTVSILNRNRNSTTTSGISSISYDGTAASGGTTLHTEYIGDKKATSGESRGVQEWVLDQNVTYAVSLYSTSSVTASLSLDWYEHTDLS